MKVAIVSINYAPELTGISVYTTGLAEGLVQQGDDVRVYTGFPYYPHWRKQAIDQWRWHGQETIHGVLVRRHYLYVPARPSALRRMLHELSFVFSATVGYLLGKRSDVTIIVSPSLFLGIPIALLARVKGSRTLFHIQDLQPDAAVELGMLKPGPLTGFFYWIERLTYRLCHRVSTISMAMRRRVIAKGIPDWKVSLLRNWANDNQVPMLSADTSYRRDWGLTNRLIVLYSGNMGVKQGLGSLLDCAEIMRQERDIVFVIVGDGGEKDALMAQAESRGLDNVLFRPLQPFDRLGELLATGDISVIPQKAGVADIVLPSKLANILASGRPVVAAAVAETELAHIVRDSDCGRVVQQEDPAAMAEAILDLRDDPALRVRLGINGRRYMEAHLGQEAMVAAFRNEMLALLPGGLAMVQESPRQ